VGSGVSDYVLRESVALDELCLLYVPVPKAGSTAILWTLADLAGLGAEDFERSHKLEVTRALTVHDLSVWGPSRRLAGRSAEEVEWILGSDDWLRITVVREPVRRVWSGWISKILFRNPRFATFVGDAPPIASSQDVLDEFRSFVRALPDRPELRDVHWASQADLIDLGNVTYGHVGRVEDLDATMAVLAAHVAPKGVRLAPFRRENPSFVPYSPGVFDERALEACLAWTARDREAFGYPDPASEGEPDEAWHAEVQAVLPAIHTIVEQNERIGDLRALVEELRGATGGSSWRRRLRRGAARL
jgi:Sulfotransferase family